MLLKARQHNKTTCTLELLTIEILKKKKEKRNGLKISNFKIKM